MGLETGSFIPDLVDTNPLGTDPKSEGDNHLRLIKTCTQGSFPAFVGTQAVPASVSLTEDELSDAGLQNRANTWGLLNTFNTQIRLGNNIPVSARNAALNAEIPLIKLDTSDRTIVGDASSQQINQCMTQNQFLVDGVNTMFLAGLAAGGVIVIDLDGSQKKAGFRNPAPNDISNGSYTLQQSDENKVVHYVTGLGGDIITVPQLEPGTCMVLINDDSNNFITLTEGGGVSLSALIGGDQLSAVPDLQLAQDSVMQLWWFDAVTVKTWGNGISLP